MSKVRNMTESPPPTPPRKSPGNLNRDKQENLLHVVSFHPGVLMGIGITYC